MGGGGGGGGVQGEGPESDRKKKVICQLIPKLLFIRVIGVQNGTTC